MVSKFFTVVLLLLGASGGVFSIQINDRFPQATVRYSKRRATGAFLGFIAQLFHGHSFPVATKYVNKPHEHLSHYNTGPRPVPAPERNFNTRLDDHRSAGNIVKLKKIN